MNLTSLVSNVRQHVKQSSASHIIFGSSNTINYPIPFFGNLNQATIITIGANPSDKEFANRQWPVFPLGDAAFAKRLEDYFCLYGGPGPHPWFNTWTTELGIIGAAYQPVNGQMQAAHIDISPRPTLAMRKCPVVPFIQMGSHDIRWFFEIIKDPAVQQNLRMLIAAGSFTKAFYIMEFIAKHAPTFNFKMQRSIVSSPGGFLNRNYLSINGNNIPIFGIGSGPSGRSGSFASGMAAEKVKLTSIIAGQSPTTVGW